MYTQVSEALEPHNVALTVLRTPVCFRRSRGYDTRHGVHAKIAIMKAVLIIARHSSNAFCVRRVSYFRSRVNTIYHALPAQTTACLGNGKSAYEDEFGCSG